MRAESPMPLDSRFSKIGSRPYVAAAHIWDRFVGAWAMTNDILKKANTYVYDFERRGGRASARSLGESEVVLFSRWIKQEDGKVRKVPFTVNPTDAVDIAEMKRVVDLLYMERVNNPDKLPSLLDSLVKERATKDSHE